MNFQFIYFDKYIKMTEINEFEKLDLSQISDIEIAKQMIEKYFNKCLELSKQNIELNEFIDNIRTKAHDGHFERILAATQPDHKSLDKDFVSLATDKLKVLYNSVDEIKEKIDFTDYAHFDEEKCKYLNEMPTCVENQLKNYDKFYVVCTPDTGNYLYVCAKENDNKNIFILFQYGHLNSSDSESSSDESDDSENENIYKCCYEHDFDKITELQLFYLFMDIYSKDYYSLKK